MARAPPPKVLENKEDLAAIFARAKAPVPRTESALDRELTEEFDGAGAGGTDGQAAAVAGRASGDGSAAVALLAGGCFWSVELVFQRTPGVLSTAVGYLNGFDDAEPTYESVCTGLTGHAEAVRVTYDPSVLSYEDILKVFWGVHDPTGGMAQGNDFGYQYRAGIYYTTDEERRIAESFKAQKQASSLQEILTEIEPARVFWPAEDYHQQYLEKGGQSAHKGDLTPVRCYG
mmetsp:Transcript_9945/g.33801  ORF Transcript_9945/g.33801 Transcript_9945/m.33801 type:complete len:231 (+) Transcript_9945:166-858(+)